VPTFVWLSLQIKIGNRVFPFASACICKSRHFHLQTSAIFGGLPLANRVIFCSTRDCIRCNFLQIVSVKRHGKLVFVCAELGCSFFGDRRQLTTVHFFGFLPDKLMPFKQTLSHFKSAYLFVDFCNVFSQFRHYLEFVFLPDRVLLETLLGLNFVFDFKFLVGFLRAQLGCCPFFLGVSIFEPADPKIDSIFLLGFLSSLLGLLYFCLEERAFTDFHNFSLKNMPWHL